LLKQSPLLPPESDCAFLFNVRQTDSRYHKNIAYRPNQDRLTGFSGTGADSGRLRGVLRAYSQRARQIVTELFAPYAQLWQFDLTSFRPLEEGGRRLPLKARNDLLHVDSFPTRPTNGNRILRVFTNINPTQSRVWLTGEAFEVQAKRMAGAAGLSGFASQACSPWLPLRHRLTRLANSGCALRVPPPAIRRSLQLLPERQFWKLFLKSQGRRPQYLRPGDRISARIVSADGRLDLGEQRTEVLAAA
jgi:hypothetical protein